MNGDPHVYEYLKGLEAMTQALLFQLPLKDSPFYERLSLTSGEEWKKDALVEYLIWFRDKSTRAATAAYMVGKE